MPVSEKEKKKRKKGINGKTKGSNYERVIAKILSKWSGETFHRTPASGALHWANDARVTSDVVPPSTLFFPINIECKCREVSWDFDSIITGNSDLWDFWKQSLRDANRADLEPMVVFSKNFKKNYVIMEKKLFDFVFKGKPKIKRLEIHYYPTPLVLCDFDIFLQYVSTKEIQIYLKK